MRLQLYTHLQYIYCIDWPSYLSIKLLMTGKFILLYVFIIAPRNLKGCIRCRSRQSGRVTGWEKSLITASNSSGSSKVRDILMKKIYVYPACQFLSRVPRRKSMTTMQAVSKSVTINNLDNIIPTEHVLYLSLIGLYKLFKYRLACKVVNPCNLE